LPFYFFTAAYDEGTQMETTRYCVLTLANITSEMSSFDLVSYEIQRMGDVKFLQHMKHPDAGVQEYLCLLLSNMSVEPSSHPLFITRQFLTELRPLLEMAREKELATRAIEHQRANNAVQDYVKTNDEHRFSLVRHIMAFLMNICVDEYTRSLVCEIMLTDLCLLISMLGDNENDQVLATGLICGFPLADRAKLIMSTLMHERPGVIFPAFDFILSLPRIETRRLATKTIARMSELAGVQEMMITNEQLQRLILRSLASTDLYIESSALRTIANICGNASLTGLLNEMKIGKLLSSSLVSLHCHCRKYAMVVVGNYGYAEDSAISLGDIALVDVFLSLAATHNADPEEMRLCLYALANCVYHERNHSFIVPHCHPLLQALFHIFETCDLQTRRYAAQVLANVAASVRFEAMLADTPLLAQILRVTRNAEDPLTKRYCMMALRALAMSQASARALARLNISAFVCDAMRQLRKRRADDVLLCEECVQLLYNLAAHPQAAEEMASSGVIPIVVSLLGDGGDAALARSAAHILAHVTSNPLTVDRIVSAGGADVIFEKANRRFQHDDHVLRSMACVIMNLTRRARHRAQLIDSVGAPRLLQALSFMLSLPCDDMELAGTQREGTRSCNVIFVAR
jgi:hypothetical protein